MNKKLFFYFIIILLIVGIVAFWYFRGDNFSKEVLKMEILGPEKSEIGKEVEYSVKYKNNGNFVLKNLKIVFDLPNNSLTEDSKIRFEKNLQDIYPGQEELVKFRGVLLGKDGDFKTANARLSYTPDNLSVRYESSTTFTTLIDNTPIVLRYNVPKNAREGQEISLSISYSSDVDYPLENASIKIDRIDGLSIKSSNPPSLDNIEWRLGTLKRGDGGSIDISGIVQNPVADHIILSVKMGVWREGSFIVIKESTQSIALPNLQGQVLIGQEINGLSNYVGRAGQILIYKVIIYNNQNVSLNNVDVRVSLEGSAFDFSVFGSEEGMVQLSDKSIFFSSSQLSKLHRIDPNSQVSVSFAIALKNNLTLESDKIIKNTVTASGITKEFVSNVNLGVSNPNDFEG